LLPHHQEKKNSGEDIAQGIPKHFEDAIESVKKLSADIKVFSKSVDLQLSMRVKKIEEEMKKLEEKLKQ
jgi:hypothetical protein